MCTLKWDLNINFKFFTKDTSLKQNILSVHNSSTKLPSGKCEHERNSLFQSSSKRPDHFCFFFKGNIFGPRAEKTRDISPQLKRICFVKSSGM